MAFNSINSIRARMTLGFALSNAVLMLSLCGSMLYYARRAAEQRVADQINVELHRTHDELQEMPLPAAVIQSMSYELRAHDMAMILVDEGGHVLKQSQSTVPHWPRQQGDGWRVATVPVGKQTLVLGYPWFQEEKVLWHQGMNLAGLSLVVVFASAVGAWMLVGRTLSPIKALSRLAQTASSASLRVRLAAPSRDAEIVDLVATWNDFLARLAETAALKGRFYAAASHELRTPLQALSGHLEVALSRARTEEEYRSVLEEAYGQTRRLTSLTQDLLLLNRLETAATPPPNHPVDLADLCERLLTGLQPLAAQRGLTVQTYFPPEITISAPPLHAEMLLRNLLENAVKYATPCGEVHVTLLSTPTKTRLDIANTFPDSPPLDAERLFEPFFRPDASRSSDTGGNGLGLAICKALALANHWQLTLHQDPVGVCFRVLFPHAEVL
ncbi:MAG TPA: ATP-binding protein [Chthonomonadaceae bacterium]|nr:ATP-binding protein [Chthonomonadaceae bacterium]